MIPMKVIDVSGWQENLNYDAAVGAGVKGVIIKISQGQNYEETWWGYLSECETRNIPWGVYCYSTATTPEEAVAEANEVLYLLGSRRPPLGVWFDFESSANMKAEDPTAVCSAFICKINEAGLSCGIYASLSTLTDTINVNALADYVPYWVAQYNSTCDFKDYYPNNKLQGWQYTDNGNIAGMQVDLNEWYLDL